MGWQPKRVSRYPIINKSDTVEDLIGDVITAADKVLKSNLHHGNHDDPNRIQIHEVMIRLIPPSRTRRSEMVFPGYSAGYRVELWNETIELGVIFCRDELTLRFVKLISDGNTLMEDDVERLMRTTAKENFALVNTVYAAFRPVLVAAGMVAGVVITAPDPILALIKRVETDLKIDTPPR